MKRHYIYIIIASLAAAMTTGAIFIDIEIPGMLTAALSIIFSGIAIMLPIMKKPIVSSIMMLSLLLLIALLNYPMNLIMATAMLIPVMIELLLNRRMFIVILTMIMSIINTAVIMRTHWQWPFAAAYALIFVSILVLMLYSKRSEERNKQLAEQLTYINAKKGIIDINPMLNDKHNVMADDSNAGLRIMEHISEAIKTLIEMISLSLKPKSVVYYVYDRKEETLYPEIGVSDEDLMLHRALENKGSILYYTVNNRDELNDNLYVGDPRELGIYTHDTLIRSVLTVPVMLEGRVTGLLYIDHSEEGRFSLNDIHMLRMYASQISRLLNFAKYAQKSKTDAAYFSLMNDTVHALANTLDFEKIMNQLSSAVNDIIAVDRMFALRCSDRECTVIFDSKNKQGQSSAEIENTFVSIVLNQKTPVIKTELSKRDIKLHIINSKEKLGTVRTAIGIPLYFFDTGETDIAVVLSKSDMTLTPMKENFINFLSDVLNTAVEKSRYYEKMRDLAVKDGLTGVYNHRYFQEQLDMFMEQSMRSGKKLALVIADIDHFKSFNDRYGHQTGDMVLKQFSSLLESHIRKTDFIARYGGEEFVIVLNNIDENVLETADKLRKFVEDKRIYNTKGEKLSITASFGVAVFPDNAQSKDGLIKEADRALYRAKENGRNQTIMA